MKPSGLLAVLAMVLDGAVVLLALDVADGTALLGCAALHAGTCLLFALGFAAGCLPLQGGGRRDAVVLGCGLACVLPVLGMAGLLLLVAPALNRAQMPPADMPWRQLPRLELPATAPLGGAADAVCGPRNLGAILHNASRAPARLAALMATLRLPDVQAAGLLRRALKDQNEDVRLLAYALLNRKEKAAEARIHGLRRALEVAAPGQAWAQHRALAYAYWELSLLGAQPLACASQVQTYACEHARQALELQPEDAGLQFLLGRMLVRQKQWGPARQAFEAAERAGMQASRTRAYRDEIDFMQGKGGGLVAAPAPEGVGVRQPPSYGDLRGLNHGAA